MIPEIGQILLIVALATSLLQFCIGIGFYKKSIINSSVVYNLSAVHSSALFIAMVCLAYSFLTDDFSVLYIASNSNTNLPNIYKIAAVWGAHEGSLLLWIFLLSLWGVLLSFSRKFNDQTEILKLRAVAIMGLVSFCFILFILYTSNPFERLFPFPEQGRSLNPLLQDPALAIHPPILYAGYVGLAVPFSLAIASLITINDHQWAGIARVWCITAWLFLTGGIALGSWWAYYELGWGGWWFWDPVENASLMPWLVATALVHSLVVTEKQKLFNGFSVLLAIIAFSLSLLGTFLVRSGVLISVHSFASDPERGMFILALIGVLTGGALIIYALRVKKGEKRSLEILSRESLLLLNNVFLCSAAALILIGTLYPLIVEMLDAGKISVGPPYFNFVILFPFLPLVFFIGLGVFSTWNSTSKNMVSSIKWVLGLSLIAGLVTAFIVFDYSNLLTTIGIILAFWTLISGLSPIFRKTFVFRNIIKVLPMSLAHIGLGLTILGVTVTSSYGITFDESLRLGQSTKVGDYTFKLVEVNNNKGPNYDAKTATVEISLDGQEIAIIYPEKRIYDTNSPSMTEAGIESSLRRDLFVALGEELGGNSWSLHLQYKPLLRLIWLGPFIMILGGLVRIYLAKPLTRSMS